MTAKFISDVIESRKEMLTDVSDRIWDYAELCYREYRSAAALAEVLKNEGFEVTEKLCGIDTAFCGKFGSGHPVIGILGEFDALSGLSQEAHTTEQRPITVGGSGHGCGHNLLGVGSLAAAIAVKEYLKTNKVSGTVIYFGTPAEEGGSGKAFLVRRGAFEGVDAALTWHPSFMNQVRTRSTLAVIHGRFTFHGISSHASGSPFLGRSALDAVELMSVGTQYMREHIPDSARVHSAIVDSGGTSANVIPARAEAVYICRDKTIQSALDIYNWLCAIAKGAAQMTQTTVDIRLESSCANIVNNTTLEMLMDKYNLEIAQESLTESEMAETKAIYDTFGMTSDKIREIIGFYGKPAEAVVLKHLGEPVYDFPLPADPNPQINPASTDVGDVSWNCPTAQMSGATWAAWTSGHSWKAVSQGKSGLAHKGMLHAGKVIARTAVELFEHPELVERAREEWKERVGEKGYVCPIPEDAEPGAF